MVEENKQQTARTMTNIEIERMGALVQSISTFMVNLHLREVIEMQPETIMALVQCLAEFYRTMRPLVQDAEQKSSLDVRMTTLREDAAQANRHNLQCKNIGQKEHMCFPEDLQDEINKLYDDLLDLRQELGLGMIFENRKTIR